MTEINAQALAESYAETGREHYVRDHFVTPVVALIRGDGSGATLMPRRETFKGDVPMQLGSLVVATGQYVEANYIIAVTEAWMKAFDAKQYEDGTRPNLERGQLARESDTDASIHTVIMVCVYDIKDMAHSYSIMSEVTGDPRKPDWKINAQQGPMEGRLVDLITGGYAASKMAMAQGALPPHTDLKERLTFLADVGHLSGALVTEVGESPERSN